MNHARAFTLVLAALALLILLAGAAEARLAPAARFGKVNVGTSDNLEYRWGTSIAVKGFEPAVSVAYRVEVQVDDDPVLNTEPVGNWAVGSAPWFHVRASCTDNDAVLGCDARLDYLKLMLVWDSGSAGESYTPSERNVLTGTEWTYAELTITDAIDVDGNWRSLGPLCASAGGACQYAWTAGAGGGTSAGVMNGPSSNMALNYIGTFRVVIVAEVTSGGTPNNVRAFNSDTCWYGPSSTSPVYACNHAFYPTRSIGFIQVNPPPVSFEPRDAACAALDDQAMRGDTTCVRTQLAAAAWMNSADIRSLTPSPATPPANSAHHAVACYSETQCWAGIVDTSLRRIGVRALTLQDDNTLQVGATHWLVTSLCLQSGCDPAPANFRIIYFPTTNQLVVLYTANKNVDADLVTRYALSKSVWTWTGTSFTSAQADTVVLQSTTSSYRTLHAEPMSDTSFVACAGHTTTGAAAAVGCLVYETITGAASFSTTLTTDQPFYPYVCTSKTENAFYVTYTFQDTTARHMKVLRYQKPAGGAWGQVASRVDDSTATPAPDLPTDRLGNACLVTSTRVYIVSMHNGDPLSRNAPRGGIRSYTTTLSSFIYSRPFPLSDVSNYPVLMVNDGSIVGLAMDGTTGRLKARFWAMNGFPLSENMSLPVGTGSTSTMDTLGVFTGANAHKLVIPRGTGDFQVLELGATPAYRVEVTKAGQPDLLDKHVVASQAVRTTTFTVGHLAALDVYDVRLSVEGYSGLAPAAWYNLGWTGSLAWPPTRTYVATGRPDPDGGTYPAGGLFVEEELQVDQCALDPDAPRMVAHRGEAIGWSCRVRDEWGGLHANKNILAALVLQTPLGGIGVGSGVPLITASAGGAFCARDSCASVPTGTAGPLAAADTYQGTSSQDEAPIQRANAVRITDTLGGQFGTSGSWGEAAPFFDVDAGVYVQGYWQGWSDADEDHLDFNTGTDDVVGPDGDYSRVLVHNARGEPSNQFNTLRITRTLQDPATGANVSSSTQTLSPAGGGRYRHAWGTWPLWTTAQLVYGFDAADSNGNTDMRYEGGASPSKTDGKAHHLRARMDVLDTHLLRGQSQAASVTVVDSFVDAADNGLADTSSPPLAAINGAWAHYADASASPLFSSSFSGMTSPFTLSHTLGAADPLGFRDVLLTLAGGPGARLRGREWSSSPGLFDHHDRFAAPNAAPAHWLITNQSDWERAGPANQPDTTSTPGALRVSAGAAAYASWASQARDLGPGSAGPTRASCQVSPGPGGRVLAWLNSSSANFQTEQTGGMATYDAAGPGALTVPLPAAQRYYRLVLHLEGGTTEVGECSLDHAPVAPTGLGDGMGAWRADDLSVAQLVLDAASVDLDEDPIVSATATFTYTQAPGPVRNESYSTTIRLFHPGGVPAPVPGYADTNLVVNAATSREGKAHAHFHLSPQAQVGSPWRVETSTLSTPLAEASFGVEARLAAWRWWAREGGHDAQPWKETRTFNRGEAVKLDVMLLNNPEGVQPTSILLSDDQDGAALATLLPYDVPSQRLSASWHWPSTTPAEGGTPHRPLVAFTLNGQAHLVQPPEGALLYRNFSLGNLWHAYSPSDTREAESFVVGAHLLWEWADQFNARGEPYLRLATYTWDHVEPESGIRSAQNPPRNPQDPSTQSADHGPEPLLNQGSTLPHVRTGIASVPVVAPAGRWTITALAADGVGNTAARTEQVAFLSPVTPWSFQCVSPAQPPRVGDLVNVSCYFAERQSDGTTRLVEPQNPVHVQFFTKAASSLSRTNLTSRLTMSLAAPEPGAEKSLAHYVFQVPSDLELYRGRTFSYRIDTVHNGLPLDAVHDVVLAPEEAPFRIQATHPLVFEPGVTTSIRVRTLLQDPLMGSVPFGPDGCAAPACAGDQQGEVRLSIKGINESCACWATYTLPGAVQNEGGALTFTNMPRDHRYAGYTFTFNWTPPGTLAGKSFVVLLQATYYGRNVSTLSEIVVNTQGGSDPLSLHAPAQVYLDEPFPLLIHAAYLNATVRTNAANLLFVTVLDPAGARLIDAAHPIELGNGAYRLLVTPRTRGAHEAFVTTLDSAGNVQSAALVFRADHDLYRNLSDLGERINHTRTSIQTLLGGVQDYLALQQNASDAARDQLVGLMQAYLSDTVNRTSLEERALVLAVQAYLLGEANATEERERALLETIRTYLSERTNQTATSTSSVVEATRAFLALLINQTSLETHLHLLESQGEARLLFNQTFEHHERTRLLLSHVQAALWQELNLTRGTILERFEATSASERELLLAVQAWLGGRVNATTDALAGQASAAQGETQRLLLAVQGYLAEHANATSGAERALLEATLGQGNASQALLLGVQGFLSGRLNATHAQTLLLVEATQAMLSAQAANMSEQEQALLLAIQAWLGSRVNATEATLATTILDAHAAQGNLLLAVQHFLAAKANATTEAEQSLLREVEAALGARLNETSATQAALLQQARDILEGRVANASTQEQALLREVQDWLAGHQNATTTQVMVRVNESRAATLGLLLSVQAHLGNEQNRTSMEERLLALAIQDHLLQEANTTAPLLLAVQSFLSGRLNQTTNGEQALVHATRAYLSDRLNQTLTEVGGVRASVLSGERFEAWVLDEYRPQTVKENATNGGVQVLLTQLTRADTAESELLAQVVALNAAVGEVGRHQNEGLSGILILQAVVVELLKFAIIGLAGVLLVTLWARLRRREPQAPLTRIVGRVAGPIDRLARYRSSTLDALRSGSIRPRRER